MSNEILLVGSVFIVFGSVLVAYRLFGKTGLYVMSAIATVLANIEVLILVEAFGVSQTLGNVTFAAVCLISDILSENEGKRSADRAVWLGVLTSAVMVVFTRYWLLFTPSASDTAFGHISAIFSTTPRVLLASYLGYFVSQKVDVALYHRIWERTARKTGDRRSMLWVRNNLSTMISQVFNTVIFTLGAFAGVYDTATLLSIMLSSYAIYFVTALLDTPFVYLSRIIKDKHPVE